MDEHLLYLRKEHGDVFATRLPTGQTIPWRPLTTGEYLKYTAMFRNDQYPRAFIEDEVFTLCVLDGALVRSIGKLKAGIVSTVVSSIMVFSGPQSLEDLNTGLHIARQQMHDAMHDLVSMICMAFPAYKPEEVYTMDYRNLMLRAAQAEKKLIQTGFIDEPIFFEPREATIEQKRQIDEQQQKRREANQDMLNKYYEQEGIHVPDSLKRARKEASRELITDHPAPPPVPEHTGETTVISKSDIMEHESFMSGHEQDIVNKVQVTKDTAQFYTGYLDELKEGGTLRIKTPEERKAAAEARMEANRQKLIERRKKALEDAKAELPQLLKVREDARRRKAKKAARKR